MFGNLPFRPTNFVEVKYQEAQTLRWHTVALVVWDGVHFVYLIHNDWRDMPYMDALGAQIMTWINSGIPTVPDAKVRLFSEMWWEQLKRIQKWPIHFGPVQSIDLPGGSTIN